MSSKKTTNTTSTYSNNQTQTRDPWQPANNLAQQGVQGVTDLYNSDYGRDFFPNQTYVGPSAATQAGLQGIINKATQGNDLTAAAQGNLMDYINGGFESPANDFWTNMMNGGNQIDPSVFNSFLNGQGSGTSNQLQNMMGGSYQAPASQSGGLYNQFLNNNGNPSQDAINGMIAEGGYTPGQSNSGALYNQFMQGSQNPANDYFSNIAGGENPYLMQQADLAANKTKDMVNSNFAKAGRYGSASHGGYLTEKVGDVYNDFLGNQYNADMNRRMQAAGALSNDYNTNINQQMNAAGAISGIEQNDLNRNMQGQLQNRSQQLQAANLASNNYFNDQGQRLSAANSLSGLEQSDLNRMLQGDLSYRNQALQAAGMLDNNYNSDQNRALTAANYMSNIGQQNIANQFGAANSLNNASQQMDLNQLNAIGMAPSLNEADYADYNRLLGVGAAQEGYDQQALQDAINRFNYAENNPIAREAQLAQLIQMYGGMGGSSNTTGSGTSNSNTVQQQSGLGSAIGNIGAGLNMFSSFLPSPASFSASPASLAQQPTSYANNLAGSMYGINAVPNYTPLKAATF